MFDTISQSQIMQLADYFTLDRAASETGLKYQTLWRRIARGKVKAERLNSRTLMIHRDEVERIKRGK